MRKATRTYRLSKGMYNLQCTTWKDKKQVTFLHIHLVTSDGDTTVKRHFKGKRKSVHFDAPPIQPDYA